MGDVNDYKKMLEPPQGSKSANDTICVELIFGRCKKSKHIKEECHWSSKNPHNKLKEKDI
jgi:hypothetical protein